MSFQRIINVKCHRYINQKFDFTLDFVRDTNNKVLLVPINICDNSDNSDICIQCVNSLWHFFTKNPDYFVRGSFDPLDHTETAM